MLDILFGALNTWGPLGNLKQVPLTGGSAQQWANSSYSIIFGDSTNWILGFGRQTNILGPDTKWVMDWNDAIPLFKNATAANIFLGVLGARGSTDLIVGSKNALNYGTRDISITSKKKAALSINYTDYERASRNKPIYTTRIVVLTLGSFVTIALNILTRITVMTELFSSSTATRTTLQNSMQFASKILTSRMIVLLMILEIAYESANELKKAAEVAKTGTEKSPQIVTEANEAASKLLVAHMSDKQSANLISSVVEDGLIQVSNVLNEVKDAVGQPVALLDAALPPANPMQGQLDSMNDTLREIEFSTSDKTLRHASYYLAATTGPIRLNASDKAQVNLSANDDGGAAIISSTSTARLQADDTILIQSGNNIQVRLAGLANGAQNYLALNDTETTLRCGAADSGPFFTMNGNEKTIILSQGNPIISPNRIFIGDNKVELSTTSNQLSVGNVKIEPGHLALSAQTEASVSKIEADGNSIIISIGSAKIIAKLDAIELAVGPNSIKIDSQGVTIAGVNIKQQSDLLSELVAKLDKKSADAISETKAAIAKNN